ISAIFSKTELVDEFNRDWKRVYPITLMLDEGDKKFGAETQIYRRKSDYTTLTIHMSQKAVRTTVSPTATKFHFNLQTPST
ncbi:unnamed protein product, partial [Allacma fusca]